MPFLSMFLDPELIPANESQQNETDGTFFEKESPPFPILSIALCAVWWMPPFFYWLIEYVVSLRKRDVFVRKEVAAEKDPVKDFRTNVEGVLVLAGSIEHNLPHMPSAKVVAGGLGKVMDLVARHHPTDIIMVHPMLGQTGKTNYGEFDGEDEPLKIVVCGKAHQVKVFRATTYPQGAEGPRVDFKMLSHPLFEERDNNSIYPNPMSRRNVLEFFSLYNQALGALIARHKPNIFHCPDFHNAVAPWYARPEWPELKVQLVLHNAEYQGGISTNMIHGEALAEMANIWNLPVDMVQKHLVLDGRFNMLKAAVDYVLEFQDGVGICGVSEQYAKECKKQYSIFWRVPEIAGLDNPMLEEERAQLTDTLAKMKSDSKSEIQRTFGLKEDPDARIFVSLGRLVRQKGVDLVADIAPWLLETHPKAQLIVVGPIGDGFGNYAAEKLNKVGADPRFKGRVFVKCEFLKVPPALKFAADFCLMPSRDEPFGYVDIEFAWCGAVLVGAQAGGLGKVPGFYYLAQNRDNLERLRRELKDVVTKAMEAPIEQLTRMAQEALECDFPLDQWQRKLLTLYARLTFIPGFTQVSSVAAFSQDNVVELANISSLDMTRKTFRPYEKEMKQEQGLDAHGDRSERRQTVMHAPVQASDAAVEQQSHVQQSWSVPGQKEFLLQELAEEELSKRVQEHIIADPECEIDTILDRIGAQVDMERETTFLSKWLLGVTCFGVTRVHVLVCMGYLASPVGEFLTIVIASEWGMRGGVAKCTPELEARSACTPEWLFTFFFLFDRDVPVGALHYMLFRLKFLSTAFSIFPWAWMSQYIQPRVLLSMSLFLQLFLLLAIKPNEPTISKAAWLMVGQGFVGGAFPLFTVFNFMMSTKGDLSAYAIRMGLLEMGRQLVSWSLTGYIFLCDLTAHKDTAEESGLEDVTWTLMPFVTVAVPMTLVPAVLLLYAPGPYRDDRMPSWDLGLFGKRVSFLVLSASDCVGQLSLFPATLFIIWLLSNGWEETNLSIACCLMGFFLMLGTGIWARFLYAALKHGMSVLLGCTLLLCPPALLRAFAQEEVSTHTALGVSLPAFIVLGFSLLLEGIRSSAIGTMKIRILNSRWRLLSYGTITGTVANLCAALSPTIYEAVAANAGNRYTRNQKELADNVLMMLLPIAAVQFFLQLSAGAFIKPDVGIPDAADGSADAKAPCWRKVGRYATTLYSLSLAVGLGVVSTTFFTTHLQSELTFKPAHKCMRVDLRPSPSVCERIWDFNDTEDGDTTTDLDKPPLRFGDNIHGHETTAKFNCRFYMYAKGGDTFVYHRRQKRCEVLLCGEDWTTRSKKELEEDELRANSVPLEEKVEVYSRYCELSGREEVGVHLFEWRWEDIANECETNLGPTGHTYVQVSPVTEHIKGHPWFTRYQPVSYKLDSRSGNEEQFVDMVKRCRAVGVQILVDIILNHMAGPYIHVKGEDHKKACGHSKDEEHWDPSRMTEAPCEGIVGTRFDNRLFKEDTTGEANYDMEDFHHFPKAPQENCGLPPWTNNRYSCDLEGLPDLDTESRKVQKQLQVFVLKLYEIGVTQLRLDAALHIYPESMGRIIELFPFDYIVGECYPHIQEYEPLTLQRITSIGSLTDFTYGYRVSQSIFDQCWSDQNDLLPTDLDRVECNNRSEYFADLMTMINGKESIPECDWRYTNCHSPLRPKHALLFVDNHDQQRERWKEEPWQKKAWEKGGNATETMCYWDGRNLPHGCRLVFKFGQEYNLAQAFMVLWPYGNQGATVRMMSSYAFNTFDGGPPGADSGNGESTSVRNRCRESPKTSPVTEEYENDAERTWICEHRWLGMGGAVRLRREMLRSSDWNVEKPWPKSTIYVGSVSKPEEAGKLRFSMSNGTSIISFVAMAKGYNWVSRMGTNESWNLTGADIGLPPGVYCDLGAQPGPVATPDAWRENGRHCEGDKIAVNTDGTVRTGFVPPGHFSALHIGYIVEELPDPVEAVEPAAVTPVVKEKSATHIDTDVKPDAVAHIPGRQARVEEDIVAPGSEDGALEPVEEKLSSPTESHFELV